MKSHFTFQLNTAEALTQEMIDNLIDGRKEHNRNFDDLLDESLIGDKFLFCMVNRPPSTETEKGIVEIMRIRESKIDKELKGFKFVEITEGPLQLPRFQQIK